MAYATGIADSAQQSVAGQKRTANVEQATGLLSNLIGETSVTQRWVVSLDIVCWGEDRIKDKDWVRSTKYTKLQVICKIVGHANCEY